jgi:hypothetical protein
MTRKRVDNDELVNIIEVKNKLELKKRKAMEIETLKKEIEGWM